MFVKGQPKTAGRKKGSPNIKLQERKDRVEKLLSVLETTIYEDVKEMPPAERAKIYVTLQEYQIPKLARTEHSGRIVTENYNVDLTPEEMKKIAQILDNDC